jgi:hypothetical protein
MKVLGKAALLALPFLMLAQGALATPGDLKLTKIALHLVPGIPQEGSCSQVIPSRCADAPVSDTGFQVVGAANTWYTLYILATDINTAVGLKRVSFKIECDPGVLVEAPWLDPPQWCANTTLVPDWLDSGTTIDIEFPTCVGTNPDPADPEGDGTVLLGVCVIGGSGKFAIGSLDTNIRTAQVINCAGEATELDWTHDTVVPLVALGEIGLGAGFDVWNVHGACTCPYSYDNPCAVGWSSIMYACCYPGVGCAGGLSQISERACAFAGGVWSQVRCSWVCTDADCQALPVPVRLTTWGAIKSMYD